MQAIPVAVRERIIHLYGRGRKTRDIAFSLGYCVAAVRRVRQNFKRRGTLEPQTHLCGRKTLLTDARRARLQTLLKSSPGATLAELARKLKRPISTINLWLARIGLSRRKNLARRRASAARRSAAKKTDGGRAGRQGSLRK